MIVKMIKNLDKEMGEMQKSFNKDLEELKNKHAENRITEIKNTLEGINSRIPEAEELISDLKDKTVEIDSEEQNKVKRMKRTENCLRSKGQHQMHQHLNYRGPRRRREKERI